MRSIIIGSHSIEVMDRDYMEFVPYQSICQFRFALTKTEDEYLLNLNLINGTNTQISPITRTQINKFIGAYNERLHKE